MTPPDPDRVILSITLRDYRPALMRELALRFDTSTRRLPDGRFRTELREYKS